MQTTSTTDFRTDLESLLGLRGVDYRYGLSKEELFHAAIAGDAVRAKDVDGLMAVEVESGERANGG
jgi:hypothetical protein